jgi:transcriptional regulator with XRE-family HTH domain
MHYNGIYQVMAMLSNNSRNVIGKNIRKFRQEKSISQDRLSKFGDLSLNTIVNMESDGNPNPTIETLNKIANALGIKVDELIK